jgi:CBS domain-containing protein
MDITGTVEMVLRHKGDAIYSVSHRATVWDALKVMAEKNVGAVLVLDEDQRLLGVFSEREWVRRSSVPPEDPRATPVTQMLTDEVVCVCPGDDIAQCMRLMTDHRVRHLPVVEGDLLVGVVSIGDLVNWVISAQDSAIEQLEHYITGVYPA